MRRYEPWMIGLVCAVAALACVERPLDEDTGGTGTTGGTETPGTPTTSGATTTPDAPGTSGPPTGSTSTEPATGEVTSLETTTVTTAEEGTCGFLCDSTTETNPVECDVLLQDCAEGQKCAPYANDGGQSWNATKCVPVTGDGQPGEPCTAQESGVSGLDDCAKGVYCWDVDDTLQGTCVEMCSGPAENPVCKDPDAFCNLTAEGVINLCLLPCDPLAQNCPGGEDLCIPVGDTFVCVLDASEDEGQVFDPCEFANACDKGLMCTDPSAASECDPDAIGCCLPLCDISKPNVCPGAGQSCVSLYEQGMAPPKFEHIGVCAIPG